MRRAQISSFGSPDVIEIADVPVPEPGPGEVLVRVEAGGLNPIDYKMRDGSSGSVAGFTDFPMPLGRELVGTVERVGEGADPEVGTRVFGAMPGGPGYGALADAAVIPAENLAVAPAGADRLQLAGTPVAGLTAMNAVRDVAEVGAGATVLVHGAGGGVGQWITQLAVRAGATVYASASGRHGERLASFGAVPLDYTTTDVLAEVRRAAGTVDVVFDAVYFDTFEPSLDLVAPGGIIVPIPTLADLAPARERGIRAAVPHLVAQRSRLEELGELLASGAASVEVSEVLPLTDLARGHRILEDGHARGKLVVDLSA